MHVFNFAAPLRFPQYWSCAWMHTIQLARFAVSSPWMREDSWCQLSTPGRAWCRTVDLITQGWDVIVLIGGITARPFVTR
jgi:hypothetical protein